jgi:hypothetical protein
MLIFLVACSCGAAPDPAREAAIAALMQAEAAAPINSGLPPTSLGWPFKNFRHWSLSRWLQAHPEAQNQLGVLEDFLRANPSLETEAAWEQIQQDQGARPSEVLVGASGVLVIAIDLSYSHAPNREAIRSKVAEELQKKGITVFLASTGVTELPVRWTDGHSQTLSLLKLTPPSEQTGWLVVTSPADPVWIPHDGVETVLADIDAALLPP